MDTMKISSVILFFRVLSGYPNPKLKFLFLYFVVNAHNETENYYQMLDNGLEKISPSCVPQLETLPPKSSYCPSTWGGLDCKAAAFFCIYCSPKSFYISRELGVISISISAIYNIHIWPGTEM